MRPAIRRVLPLLVLAPVALAVLALDATAAPGAVGYQHESLAAFEAQLKGGQIHEATLNKRLRRVHLSLTDGRHMLAEYAPHEEPHVLAELNARHVPVSVLGAAATKKAGKKPVHHKLRYIAGGIVIAVIVIVGGVMLYNRRRRPIGGLS
jgi:hypothetical protein